MDEMVVHVIRQALVAVVVISAPATVAALGVGLFVSVAQTATQVQEQTLSYVPKLLAVALALTLFGPWMLGQLVRLAANAFEQVALVAAW
jgi:flagellar biosynthetic protein FliQ